MTGENKYQTFSAADIEKYHRGQLTPAEMHAIEKAALDDPFLADALEGYSLAPVNVAQDMEELQQRLQSRVNNKERKMTGSWSSGNFMKIAAALVLLVGIGFAITRLVNGNGKPGLANNTENKQVTPLDRTVDSTREGKGIVSDSVETNAVTSKLKDKSPGFINTQPIKNGTAQINDVKERGVAAPSYYQTTPLSIKDTPTNNYTAIQRDIHNRQVSDEEKSKSEAVIVGRGNVAQKATANISMSNYFKGKVLDNNNNPVPFANITNTRDNVGTYTDAKGNFTLISSDSVMDVQVKANAFLNNQAILKNNTTVNMINLQQDSTTVAPTVMFRNAVAKRKTTDSNIKLEEPEPADGWSNYDSYLANNIKIPEDIKIKKTSGEVEVSFEVDKLGEPVNIRIEQSLCSSCDQEAMRLVKEGPRWKKKGKQGKRVTVKIPFH
jgi:TonB family protein